MVRYQIVHGTHFHYTGPVRESVMELRMRPREDGRQTCEQYALSITPHAPTNEYIDPYGNLVSYFTLPRPHESLEIIAKATVDVAAPPTAASSSTTWHDLAALRNGRDFFPWMNSSHYARPSAALQSFADEVSPDAILAPQRWLTALGGRLCETIRYTPHSTSVDSPIEDCLAQRAGVCQDFAHVFIALARRQGVPCRYVSGYLFHREDDAGQSGEDATHAWVEAFVPDAGWMGFDPANGITVGDRHVRVAVGRDYYDVPPTRGVYRGPATRQHEVQVRVQRVGLPAGSAEEKKAMSGFQCQVQMRTDAVVAQLVGSFGAANVEALEHSLFPAIDHNPRCVILDLAGLAMLGSAGIGALIKLRRKVESGGGRLVLAAVPEPIHKVFVFSKLDSVFIMAPGVDEAMGKTSSSQQQ